MNRLSTLLLPFSALYDGVTALRNHLYDIQQKRSVHFTPFIISVGNLRVGGTGKTPMVIYLTEWLAQHHPLAILSRGYGRKTRGVRIATEHDTAQTLGDEPYLFYRRFGHSERVTVAVGEERVVAVPEIIQHAPATGMPAGTGMPATGMPATGTPAAELILLDDAYQHRAIGRDFNILLTSYAEPFYADHVLPAGRLRESRRGAKRADVVIVTKCPDGLPDAEQQRMTQRVQRYTQPDTPVFFTGLRYGEPRSPAGRTFDASPVVLFSGLADASLFDAYARQHFSVTEHITFGDHHRYTAKDQQRLKNALATAGATAGLLTTEKDVVKFENTNLPLFYLPIQPYFLSHKNLFHDLVLQRIREYTGV